MQGHKTSIDIFKKTEITHMFSDHNRIELKSLTEKNLKKKKEYFRGGLCTFKRMLVIFRLHLSAGILP